MTSFKFILIVCIQIYIIIPLFFNLLSSGSNSLTAALSAIYIFLKYSNFYVRTLIYSTYCSFISLLQILSIKAGSKTALSTNVLKSLYNYFLFSKDVFILMLLSYKPKKNLSFYKLYTCHFFFNSI